MARGRSRNTEASATRRPRAAERPQGPADSVSERCDILGLREVRVIDVRSLCRVGGSSPRHPGSGAQPLWAEHPPITRARSRVSCWLPAPRPRHHHRLMPHRVASWPARGQRGRIDAPAVWQPVQAADVDRQMRPRLEARAAAEAAATLAGACTLRRQSPRAVLRRQRARRLVPRHAVLITIYALPLYAWHRWTGFL